MPAARPDLRHPLTVRLTTAQDEHIRELARERGVTPSESLRSLVDAGALLEQASRLGLVVTRAARALLTDGHMTRVGFALNLTDEQLERLGLTDEQLDQVRDGAAVLGTREELQAL